MTYRPTRQWSAPATAGPGPRADRATHPRPGRPTEPGHPPDPDATPTIPGPAGGAPRPEGRPDVPGFEVFEEIGRGGMGVVYRAVQKSVGRAVALKVLADPAGWPDRFRSEAEAVARLDHPNIVRVYEVGRHAGLGYLALELVEGPSLAARLAAGPLAPAAAAALVETLARAVEHAHRRGVVHRDLKPGNVLLAVDGRWQKADGSERQETDSSLPSAFCHLPSSPRPKVTDFGLAKRLDAGPGQTRTGVVVGTPSYMAPEQAAGRNRDVGPAADVYALGAILYECLTGRPPFEGDSPIETVMRVLEDEPVPPRELVRSVPADLEAVCLKCLAKGPAGRYRSAAELADDLARYRRGSVVLAARVGPVGRWLRRHGRGLATAAALLGLAAAGAGTSWWRHGRAVAALRDDGLAYLDAGRPEAAEALFRRGLEAARRWPTAAGLVEDLEAALVRARAWQAAAALHELVERLRGVTESDLPPTRLAALADACGRAWAARAPLAPRAADPAVRDDLAELACAHAELLARRTGRPDAALAVLGEARALVGPSFALDLERSALAGDDAPPPGEPVTARDLAALGRYLLVGGRTEEALAALTAAAAAEPAAFWPQFYRGVAAFRLGRHDEAVTAFSVCEALAPRAAACAYNRGLALERLGRRDDALRDYARALALDPGLADAALNRAALLLAEPGPRPADALEALGRAEAAGAGPFDVALLRARAYARAGDAAAARAQADRALAERPGDAAALALRDRLPATTAASDPR